MAEKRLDVLQPRDYVKNGEKKTAWVKLGVAWLAKDGVGYDVNLESIPLPSMNRDGTNIECRFRLMVPKEFKGGGRGGGGGHGGGDDDAPF